MVASTMLRTLSATGLAVVLGVAATACSGSGADSSSGGGGETTIRLGYAGSTLAPSAGLYTSIPDALGFWKKEGVKVEVVRVEGSTNAIAAIAGGKLDVAVVSGDPVIQAAASGTPVVIPFVLTSKNIVVTAVPDDSDIDDFADLEGKKVGVPILASGAVQYVQAAVSQAGGDASSVKFVAVGTGAQAASALKSGAVDADADTDSAIPVLEEAGIQVRSLTTPLDSELRESVSAVTSRAFMKKDPDAVAGWAKGVAEATVWAGKHPEEAVKLHYDVFPNERPPGDAAASDKLSLLQLKERLDRSLPPDGEKFSALSDGDWNSITGFLVKFGLLKRSLAPAKFWDGSLVTKINDFDRSAVEATKP